jgi:hypothetical protein
MQWTYDTVVNLPNSVYEVLVEMLINDARDRGDW